MSATSFSATCLRNWLASFRSRPVNNRRGFRARPSLQTTQELEGRRLLAAQLADGGLQMKVVTAYNLVVDSNVETPATYGPKSAYLGVTITNAGSSTLSDVLVNIGNLTNASTGAGTPGVYPVTTIPDSDPLRDYSGSFSFTHQGGVSDASRLIPSIAPGQVLTQYFLVSYPVTDTSNNSVTGSAPVVADDLELFYDVWISAQDPADSVDGTRRVFDERKMTARNEISAMANKIWPNTNGKVPDEYLDAIQASLGWRPSATASRIPGAQVSEGVWYDLGNVGFGFDNDGDFVPDRNAWLQPVGDPDLFDASAGRLVKCYGLLIVKLNDGTEQLLPFEDQMYFEHVNPNNTGVVGLVWYEYLPLRYGSTLSLSPYQEVASGYDNEKFNGDYGTSVPPVTFGAPSSDLTLNKSGSLYVSAGEASFNLLLNNSSSVTRFGWPEQGLPAVIEDSIPANTTYKAGSAAAIDIPTGASVTVYYSTNNRTTWTKTEPAWTDTNGNSKQDPGEGTVTDVRWVLSKSLLNDSFEVKFSVLVPSNYATTTGPTILNTGSTGLLNGASVLTDTHTVLVSGSLSLGDTIFRDDGSGAGGVTGDGIQNGTESGLSGITVSLYYDADGDGVLDSTDPLWGTTTSGASGGYSFTSLPAAKFIVVADPNDTDIPTGWNLSTKPQQSVTLTSANVLTADFGFSPTLDVTKTLQGQSPAYEGSLITYSLDVTNLLKGEGYAASLPSESTLWLGTTSGTFTNTSNAAGSTTGNFASSSTNANNLRGTNPAAPDASLQKTPITHVEAILRLYTSPIFRDGDKLTIEVTRAGTVVGTYEISNAVKAFSSVSKTGDLALNLTSIGGWTWQNLTASNTGLNVTLTLANGSNTPTVYIDRLGFRVTSVADQARTGAVYWADSTTTLKTGPSGGGEVQVLMPSLTASVSDIANDQTNGYVYLAAGTLLTKADSNGATIATATAGGTVTGLDVDAAGGFVYWVESSNKIRRASLNFASPTTVVSSLTNVTALTIDPVGGRLYWSESGNSPVIIKSVRLVDLGQASPAITTVLNRKLNSSGNSNINDLEVDYVGQKLYFTDDSTGADYIGVVDFNGANARKLIDLSATNPAPSGLAVDTRNSRIYWGDNTGINYAGITGTGSTLLYSGQTTVKDVEVLNFPVEYFGTFDFNKTLSVVPLTDDYDPAELSFVSATISPDSVNTSTGLLTWSNIGPINAGSTKSVLVTFRVLEPAGNNTDSSVINTANVSSAQLANGQMANDDSGTSTISVLPTGAIGNFVWRDSDGGADQDAGEPGLQGITVELYEDLNGNGALDTGEPLMNSTVTDSSGAYLFNGLAPDDGTYKYIVKVNTAGLFNFTSTYDATSPANSLSAVTMTNPAGVGGPSDNLLQDFGYSFTNNTRVYGSVWQDYDRDGIRDSGIDPGIAEVTVSLFNSSNVSVATTTTAADGSWNFYGMAPGSYSARVTTATLPATGTWAQTADPDATKDSITPTGGTFTLAAGGTQGSFNFGYGLTGTSSIGDTVFIDWDGDNIFDSGDGDVGIPSVTVSLYLDLNNNGSLDLGTDPLVSTAVTDASGAYLFSSLPAATYFVVADELDADFPPSVTASAENPRTVALYSAVSLLTVDFGYQPYGDGQISGTVWDDGDFSETQQANEPGLGSVTVELWWDRFGTGSYVLYKTQATDSSGAYKWDGLPYGSYEVRLVTSDPDIPGGHVATTPVVKSLAISTGASAAVANFGLAALPSLGDTVYYDANRSGSQDASESGIPNVTVRLFLDTNADGLPDGSALKTTTTDSSGHFNFASVQHTEPGQYYVVVVDTSTLPSSMLNSGDPDRDGVPWTGTSDAFPDADSRDSFIEVLNSSYRGADFGYAPAGVIGDFVWLDLNGDGLQTAGERGIAGVTVTAFKASSSTTVTTETDQDGMYSFSNLANGVWTISVSGSALSGLQGTYDADGGSFSSTTVTITAGVISSPAVGSLGVDFGLTAAGSYSLTGTVATHDARTTGTADDIDSFADDGIDRDAGTDDELELSGQTLYLYKIVSGSPVYLGSTATDSAGNYAFNGLPAAEYRVVLSTGTMELQNSTLTTTDASSPASAVVSYGKDTNSDGNIDILTSVAQTVTITSVSVSDVDFTFVSAVNYDFGDLPDSFGATRLADDGARHIIPSGGSTVWLGTAPDADVNGASGAFADGDDILGYDDDDGVVALNIGNWTNGTNGGSIQVVVPAGKTGYLTGWIDFNHDNSLIDSGEFIVSQWITGTGSSQTITFNIPAGTIGATSESWLARFRIFVDQPAFPLFSYEGVATDGEVEDHLFSRSIGASIGNRVWVDSDADGVQDTAETGLPGILVTLRDLSGNRITDQLTSNGTQDVDGDGLIDPVGYYRFSGLTATTDYRVTISAPTGYSISFDEDSGTSSPDGVISVTDLETNSQRQTADFGLQPMTAKISGTVYNDTNSGTSGAFDAEDSRLSGVVIQLWLDPNQDGDLTDGLQVGETTTDSSGNYAFNSVPSGRYVLIEKDPSSYTSVLDTDSLNDNRISVNLTGTDSTGNNYLDVTSVVAFDVSISKSNGSATVIPGSTTTWTIVVTNNGPITATGISVSDTKPSWVSTWSWSGNGLTGQTGNLSDTISRLQPGASVTYTAVANVKPDVTGSTLTNTASISATGDTDATNNSASDTDSASVQYDVSVTKTDGTTTVVPGSTTTYTITVSNAGPSTATSISVSDSMPSWIQSWTWSGNGLTAQTGNLTDTITTLAPGSSKTYTVVATVKPDATGSNLQNTATISAAADTTAANNSATDTDTANVQYDVSVTKTDGTTTAVPGSTTTYTITVSNAGPSTATSISVSDSMPSWIQSWTWSGNGLTAQTGNLTDTITTLAPGSSKTYTVVATVKPDATGSNLQNTATISAAADTTAANNSATDTDTANVQYDVSVTKTDGTTAVVPGSTTTYTITVSNTGPSTATSISVSDSMPSWIQSWTWSGNGLTAQTGNLTDTITTLAPGSSTTYTVVATVKSDATGSNLQNTATISAAADTTAANNSATDTDTANVQYDVSVTKTDGTTTVVPGSTTTYTITVSNAGPSTATSISVSDSMPSWIQSWTWSGNGLTAQTGSLTDTITTLAPGSSKTYTVVATVKPDATGSNLQNTVTISAAADTSAANNSATDTNTASVQYDVSVTKTDGTTTVVPGSTTTYTITVSNAGPSTATSISVSDSMPSWIQSWTWSGNGLTAQTGNLTDTITTLAPGSSKTYTVVATVKPDATGSNLQNTATISAAADTSAANNSATDTNTANVQYDVSVTKTDGTTTVVPGSTTTYTITVSNAGPSTATSISVSDSMPSWIQSWTWSGNGLTGQTGDLTDTITTLAPGGSKTYTVVATVKATATGNSLTNTATISASADTNTGNNSSSDTDTANAAPVAVNDIRVALLPGTQSIQVTANDTDPANTLNSATLDLNPLSAGEQKTLTVTGQGTWTVLNDGWVQFAPTAGFTLDPTPINYTVKNTSSLESNVATITLDYRPIANPDNSANNTPGTSVTLSVLANDTSGDTDFNLSTLTIYGTSTPGASLVVPGQGTWTVSLVNSTITFTPEAGFNGDPSPIRYNIRDTDGNVSNYAVVTIDYIDQCVGFPLTLIIDDTSTAGYDIIVVDNAPAGTTTAFGNTTHADLNNLTLGNLGFLGSTTKFSYITVTALSKPYLTGTVAPDMSITSSFRSTGTGGTLNMYVTDGCFSIVPGTNYSLVTPFGGTTVGTVSFSETVDPLNQFLSTGTGKVSNSLGPLTNRSFSGTATQPFNFSTTDASLTKSLNLKHGSGTNLSTSFRAGGKLASEGHLSPGITPRAFDDGAFIPSQRGRHQELTLMDELLSLMDHSRFETQAAVPMQSHKQAESFGAKLLTGDHLRENSLVGQLEFQQVRTQLVSAVPGPETIADVKPNRLVQNLLLPLLKLLGIRKESGAPATEPADTTANPPEILPTAPLSSDSDPAQADNSTRVNSDANAGSSFAMKQLSEIVADLAASLECEQR